MLRKQRLFDKWCFQYFVWSKAPQGRWDRILRDLKNSLKDYVERKMKNGARRGRWLGGIQKYSQARWRLWGKVLVIRRYPWSTLFWPLSANTHRELEIGLIGFDGNFADVLVSCPQLSSQDFRSCFSGGRLYIQGCIFHPDDIEFILNTRRNGCLSTKFNVEQFVDIFSSRDFWKKLECLVYLCRVSVMMVYVPSISTLLQARWCEGDGNLIYSTHLKKIEQK